MKLRLVLKPFTFNAKEYKKNDYISEEVYLTLSKELQENVDSNELELLIDYSSSVEVT